MFLQQIAFIKSDFHLTLMWWISPLIFYIQKWTHFFFFLRTKWKNQQQKINCQGDHKKNKHHKYVHVLIFPFYVSECFQNLGLFAWIETETEMFA